MNVCAAVEPDLRPDLGRQRLGRDHERVHRGDRRGRDPGRCARPGLGRADHPAGAHDAVVGDDRARGQPQRARPLGDPGAAGRAPRRAARGPAAAGWTRAQSGVYEPPTTPVGADVLRDPVGVEQVRLVAPARRRRPTSAATRSSCGRLRASVTVPPNANPQSICSAAATPPDLDDGVPHGGAHRRGGVVPVPAGQLVAGDGQERRAPAAVAPARAEPGDLGLDHEHVERRVGLEQVVRGPQPGQPGADDDDVRLRVPVERGRAAARVVGSLVEPERRAAAVTGAPRPRSARRAGSARSRRTRPARRSAAGRAG